MNNRLLLAGAFLFSGLLGNAQDYIYSTGKYGQISKYQINSTTGAVSAPTSFGDGTTDPSRALAINSSGRLFYIPFVPTSPTNSEPAENQGKMDVYSLADGATTATKVVDQYDVNGTANTTKINFVRLGIDASGMAWTINQDWQAANLNDFYITKFQTNPNGTAGTPQSAGTLRLSGLTSLAGGDLAFDETGSMFILLSNPSAAANRTTITIVPQAQLAGATATSVITARPNWVLKDATTMQEFTTNVNGLAFSSTGSLFVSTDDGIYFVDENTVNTAGAGTVLIKKVYTTAQAAQVGDLASFYYAQTSLPVKFGTITAEVTGNQLSVDWITEAEKDNSYFEVEVSADGNRFTRLGTVNSKAVNGNSSVKINYQFTQSIPENALLYSAFLLPLIALPFFKQRKKMTVVFMAVGMLAFAGCGKNNSGAISSEGKVFVRIAQVDKDGKKDYSKVVVATKKN